VVGSTRVKEHLVVRLRPFYGDDAENEDEPGAPPLHKELNACNEIDIEQCVNKRDNAGGSEKKDITRIFVIYLNSYRYNRMS
jgi:hypothetical protein